MSAQTSSAVLLTDEELRLELIREDSIDPQWPHLWDDEGYLTSWEERQCED